MEKKITFELTIDQIAVIRSILKCDNAVSLFGDQSYYGDDWIGDACWMTLLEKFKCCKHGTDAEFYTNGTFYNAELNRLDQYHKRYEHVEKDYWADSVNEVKELFGVE